jgi:pyrroline-5-carboxylate reductase
MQSIGFVGSGNMAEALIRGILAADIYEPSRVFISDVRQERLEELGRVYGVTASPSNADLILQADIVVLSVKPQVMPEALESLGRAASAEKLFISIAAGVPVAKLAAGLGDVPIVRVMPNTPALIGEGAAALFANELAEPHLDTALAIFSAVGRAVVVTDERLIDAVTAVSGSGPAYFFLLMEAMVGTAVSLGLSQEVAESLVLQTARGAGILAADAAQRGESPAALRRKVTSPGGTTEAALEVLATNGFQNLVDRALTAARDRSRELSG